MIPSPRPAARLVTWGVLALIAAAAIVGLVTWSVQSSRSSDALAAGVNAHDYQAVFLANNEVYFGKLSVPANGEFCTLRHVYRLTVAPAKSKGQPLQRTLVRLTSDVQTPEDELIINRRDILYVENLNPTGNGARLLAHGNP